MDPSLVKTIIIEKDYIDAIIAEREILFCIVAIERVWVQQRIRELPDGRDVFLLMLIEPFSKQCMDWNNESICLCKIEQKKLGMD